MKKTTFFVLLGVLIAGMVVGTFFDLQLSAALYNDRNFIANFTNLMAMVPSCIIMIYCAGVVNWFLRKTKMYYPSMLLPIGGGVMAWREVGKWAGFGKPVWILLGIACGAATIALFHIRKPEITKKQFIIAFMFLAATGCTVVNVEILKRIMGRRRYYAMDDPATQFTPWYKPVPGADGDIFESFPSGHTSFSMLLTFIIYLPEMLKVELSRRNGLIIALVWVCIVMYGRIAYGAHFLTDVCAGAIIGLTWSFIGQLLIEKAEEIREKARSKAK